MTSEEFRTNPMFLRNQFKGDGVFEIPKIEKEEMNLEKIELIGYDRLCEKEKLNPKPSFAMVSHLKKCRVRLLLLIMPPQTTSALKV